jgi:hypothetical protein
VTDSPIFVVGFGRSGTTLLQAVLGAHPRIAAPPEVRFVAEIVAHADAWGDLHDDAVLRKVITTAVKAPRLRRAGWDVDRLVERALTRPRDFPNVIDTIMSDFAERNGKVRWAEKTPLDLAGDIWALFPDAQVIHIVRHPEQNIPSHVEKLGIFRTIGEAAFFWRRFTERNERDGAERGASHFLRLRYEDLTADPETVLRQVFAFLREDYDAQVVNDPSRRAATIGRGNEFVNEVLEPIRPAESVDPGRLSPTDRRRIAAATRPAMRLVGYPEPPRRDVLVGRLINVPTHTWLSTRHWFQQATAAVRTPRQRLRAHDKRKQQRMQRLREAAQKAEGN